MNVENTHKAVSLCLRFGLGVLLWLSFAPTVRAQVGA
jgi:hypothetical protein